MEAMPPSDMNDSAGFKLANRGPSDSINLENLLSSSSSIIELEAVVVLVVLVAPIDVLATEWPFEWSLDWPAF